MAIIRPVVGHNAIGTGEDDQFRTFNTMAAVGLAGDDTFRVVTTGAHYWYGGSGNDTYKASAFSEIVIFEDAASPWDTLNISSESAQFLRFAIVDDRHLLISGFATTFIADFMSPRGKIENFQIMDEQRNIVTVSLDTMWAKYIASAPHIDSSTFPQLSAKLALRGQATAMEQTLPGFNENYYLTHNADIAAAVANGDLLAGAAHYAMNGGHEGRSPNLVYDEHFYMANPTFQAAVLGAGMTGYEHYVHYGQYEGLQPSAIYNDAAYLAANPDVQQAVTTGFFKTGFEHYAQSGQYEGRALAPEGNAPLVAVAELDTADAPAALAHTPFAAASAVTTLDSTVLHALASSMLNAEAPSGRDAFASSEPDAFASSEPDASAASGPDAEASCGLLTVADPNAPAWFDETVYLQSKLEQLQRSHEGTYTTVDQVQQAIVDAGMTPYAHYARYGEAEGVSPNAYFNPVLYARALAASWNSTQHNGTDVWNETDPLTFAQKMGVTLYEHFSAKGDRENINPSNTFDVSAYLEAKGQHCGLSPEATLQAILAAGLDPLTHYLHYGKAEGIPVGVVPTSEAVSAQTWWNPLPQDPLFGDQWHLLNTGQEGGTPGMDLHIVPAWHDYTGKGVTVGVVDTGVEFTHPDLSAHIDTDKSFGAVTDPKTHIVYDKHGEPIFNASETVQSPDSHGMSVAGLVGALANDLGGVGVAPDSTIASIYIALGVEPSQGRVFEDTTNFNRALQQADDYDILTNSWGNSVVSTTTYDTLDEYHAAYADLRHAVSTGRDGLGTVVLVAAGNNSGIGDDANLNAENCTPFTITVGGVDYKGQPVSYATPGANVLVSAPTMTQEWTLTEEEPHVITQNKGGITTTDRQGAEGYAPSDYENNFSGTSASTPMVAGVVALMLEANPNLGYRDVQDILAATARSTAPEHAGNVTNGATDWNGGGMIHNAVMGYGLVDATGAVRMAEAYAYYQVEAQTAANLKLVTTQTLMNQSIPNGTGESLTSTVAVSDAVNVEYATVLLNLHHLDVHDLIITLTSPSGTVSTLLNAPYKGLHETPPSDGDISNNSPMLVGEYIPLTSAAFLGENGEGQWQLSVFDKTTNSALGEVEDWSLQLSGKDTSDKDNMNDVFVYTNDFGTLAKLDPSRTVFTHEGHDLINTAPVTSDVYIDMRAGGNGMTIAGAQVTLGEATEIDGVYTGDGNDTVITNDQDNDVFTGRGDDTIHVIDDGSWDWINGGTGFNTVVFSATQAEYTFAQDDFYVIVYKDASEHILENIQQFVFADATVNSCDFMLV